MDKLRSISKQSRESVSPEQEKGGYSGKDLQKRKVLRLEWNTEGVMDNESGESMKSMEEVSLRIGWVRIGEINVWLMVRSRELIPEMRGSILEGTICYL